MIARHTPDITDKRVTRLITVDVALLGNVGDALAILTNDYQWVEIGDPVADVIDALRDTLDSYYQDSMIGKIDQFISTPPAAWLEFDGSTYDELDYPELTEIIPAGWRSGGDFTLPDLAGSFYSSVGSSGTVGATGGDNSIELTVAQLPAHSHLYTPPVLTINAETPTTPVPTAGIGTPTQTGNTGSGDSIDNRPEFISFILAIYSGRAL